VVPEEAQLEEMQQEVGDHYRAVKLLHSLNRTVWSGKVEAILESEKYETLTVDELFSKLKSSEVD
jgi:hypothetical protein